MSVFALFLAIALVAVGTASSNSNGAPANAAKDGCGCHGPLSSDSKVTIVAPAEYEPGLTYDIKVSVTGPAPLPSPVGQNAGGFALSVSAGTLSGSGAVRAADGFATHTASGNDQRSWDLKWTAPQGAGDVAFNASANAVNGDSGQFQDRWNRASLVSKAKVVATNSTTPPSDTPSEESSFLSAALVGALLMVTAFVWRRR